MADELLEDPVRVAVDVQADLARTFRCFAEETDAWWKRGERFRFAGEQRGRLHLEPFLHGRLFEAFDRGGVTRVVRIGRVQIWDPPEHVAFEWRAPRCRPTELSEVAVRFESIEDDTRVTLIHRGWSKLPVDHPARVALGPMPLFWRELLDSLAAAAKR